MLNISVFLFDKINIVIGGIVKYKYYSYVDFGI